jgi:hypothetical protein
VFKKQKSITLFSIENGVDDRVVITFEKIMQIFYHADDNLNGKKFRIP